MTNRNFLYVYTDDNDVITNIENTKSMKFDGNQYMIPIDADSDFITLKQKFDQNCLENYAIANLDGEYTPKKIFYLYYDKKKKTIESISPILIEQDNPRIVLGKIEFDDLLEDILKGTKSSSKYCVNDDDIFLTLEERVQKIDDCTDIGLLRDSKICSIVYGREIEIRYNHKKQRLIVHCVYPLPISSIMLYFTAQNDRTILYNSYDIVFQNGTSVVENVDLPEKFDIYSPMSNEYKFLYKEEVDE